MPKYNFSELEQFFKSASQREVEALAAQYKQSSWEWSKNDFDKWVSANADYSDDKYGAGVNGFLKAKKYMANEIEMKKIQKVAADGWRQGEREAQEKKEAAERRKRQEQEDEIRRRTPKEDDFYNTPEGRRVRMARELAEIEKNRDHADDARIDAMMRILSDLQK
jgi:hypothetical protein